MLQLARKLADCDSSFFGGWILAGADVEIKGQAVVMTNKTLLQKERQCIMEVTGTTAFGTRTKKLRVFLVLPQDGAQVQDFQVAYPGKLVLKHTFTAAEIQAYVEYTGDQNIIHQGEHPLVPGLCMAAYVQEAFQLAQLKWRLAFKAPVYAGDELVIYANDQQLTAYVHTQVVFVIKLS